MSDSQSHLRRIRSFVRRAGRTTLAQEHAIATLGNQFLFPFQDALFDWSVFGAPYQDAPRIIEIGFGMGESTAQIAQVRPNDVFLGL